MKLNNQIDIIVYENKYKDLSNQLDRLRQEKLKNANQEMDPKSVKERIKEYKNNFYKIMNTDVVRKYYYLDFNKENIKKVH